ncbi:helix-turn-helix domain-containing protein [Streptomyces odontomachi]|uniref:helix-turn-helix domain-containing protein n=1 Tax=Streptomyces odontomachi TaxID=2944940 RepID=UPI00210E2498|nr:helix-turn-helix domain-containing protein [Streptomyces sp. ODS25]
MVTRHPATGFGELLHRYRKHAALTQTELAGFSAVSVRAIRNLELGQARNPRRDTVRLLADTLGLAGERRAAFLFAAGHKADDAAFDDLMTLPALAAIPLHGRTAERDRLLTLFAHGGGRLATVRGFGGVGKTRLALSVAHALREQHGVPTLWMSPSHASPGAAGRPGARHVPTAAGLEQFLGLDGGTTGEAVRLIGDRSVLLVVDGNDDGQVTHETVRALLASCRGLRVLESSRCGPAAPADLQMMLRPLPVEAPSHAEDVPGATHAPALGLLLDRIREIQPDFRVQSGETAVLEEICFRLDGVPRALEAAASWFPLSSPCELLDLARSEPHLLATSVDGALDDRWVEDAVAHALAGLAPAHRSLVEGLGTWDTPWTLEQISAQPGVGRARAAAAVHALLHCGLVQRRVSAGVVAFTALHLVRACLNDRLAAVPFPAPGTPTRTEQGTHD